MVALYMAPVSPVFHTIKNSEIVLKFNWEKTPSPENKMFTFRQRKALFLISSLCKPGKINWEDNLGFRRNYIRPRSVPFQNKQSAESGPYIRG